MSEQPRLYNSMIPRVFLKYIRKNYPDIKLSLILKEIGISDYEIEDTAHWFTQEQMDRFYFILVSRIGANNIAREAGRYAALSEGMGSAKQYVLGLMSPTANYLLMEKLYPLVSRGANIQVKKLTPNSVEIVSTPKPGVEEKLYQCENRTGFFEAQAVWFTDEYAQIEHPVCLHKGGDCCRYIITWEKTVQHAWKRIRNYSLILGLIIALVLLFLLPAKIWAIITLISALVIALFSYNLERLEKRSLTKTVEIQREAAKDNLIESNIRYNNALLIQEIGQATSKILDIDRLVNAVSAILAKHLEFDRGMIMLADKAKTRLKYTAGFGHTPDHKEFLKQMVFHLDNPDSKGLFVKVMRECKPLLINNITDIERTLSPRSREFANRMGTQSLICVPIVYEQEALGILAVDNIKSKMPLRQSDMNLLLGVASQLATSIMNARSFKKIQQNENKYRELVETANSIILRIDVEGHITFSNKFAQRFFGYSRQEMLSKNTEQLIWPKIRKTRLGFENWIEMLKKDPERPLVGENETARRNKEKVWIAWTYKPIFNDEGSFKEILCIGNDITELKRADQEKKDLQAQLQRAQKMEAIGTLAGGVAHDLNNILSGIVSYPELLLMDLEDNSPLIKPILTIQKSGEKAAAIVQDLLTLARRGVAATEVVDLNNTVREYLLSPEHEKLLMDHSDVEVEHQLDANLLNILGSPVHLSKTIMNLVSNAAEAMLDGGKITIRTENRHEDRHKFAFDEIGRGDYVILTVADTGIGISEEDIERIFEPFYTKKSMGRSGTGLGMAVVWGTVKDHRGFIDIKSKEGKGTSITLYFPVTRKELAKEADILSLDEIKGRGESILVVDDIMEQRQIASEILEKLGYVVKTVSSGEEAVNYLHENSADLIVLDMIMEPGIDGLETYKQILKIHPGQKTIIASGYSESERVKEAQKIGAGTYIKKPYLLENFGWAVKTELESLKTG